MSSKRRFQALGFLLNLITKVNLIAASEASSDTNHDRVIPVYKCPSLTGLHVEPKSGFRGLWIL